MSAISFKCQNEYITALLHTAHNYVHNSIDYIVTNSSTFELTVLNQQV